MRFQSKFYLFAMLALATCWLKTVDAQTIDGFDEDQLLNVQISGPTTAFSVANGAGILGMQRDVELELTSPFGQADIEINGMAQPSRFKMDVGPISSAVVKVTWDGVDNLASVDFTGLGGLDFNALGDKLAIEVASNQLAAELKFTVWSNAGNSSEFSLNVPAMVTSPQVFEMPFADFVGSASFSNVGAIQLEIDSMVPNDLAIDLFAIAGDPQGPPSTIPEPTTMAMLLLSSFGFGMFAWRRGPGGHHRSAA